MPEEVNNVLLDQHSNESKINAKKLRYKSGNFSMFTMLQQVKNNRKLLQRSITKIHCKSDTRVKLVEKEFQYHNLITTRKSNLQIAFTTAAIKSWKVQTGIISPIGS